MCSIRLMFLQVVSYFYANQFLFVMKSSSACVYPTGPGGGGKQIVIEKFEVPLAGQKF